MGMQAPETMREAATGIGVEGAIQGVAEGVGGLGWKAGKALFGATVKKPLGQLLQIITKIKPEHAATVFRNPKTMLPGQMEAAEQAWKEAADKAGFKVDDPLELLDILKKDAKETVETMYRKLQSGVKVAAQDIQQAKQALDIGLMPAAKTEKNKPLIALYSKVRKSFMDALGKESPELAQANKQYAVAKAGEQFKSLFPRNLDGSPAYFRSSILPSAITGAGAMRGEPGEGALQAAATTGLTSPIAMGSGIALTSLLTPVARRTLLSSIINASTNERANDVKKLLGGR